MINKNWKDCKIRTKKWTSL